jgi:tRNA(Ile)-lysidine synthase
MLDFFNNAKVDFVIAHFNHHIRTETSDRDENFVKGLAEKYNKEFYVGHGVDIQSAKSVEAEARNQRYEFLRKVKDMVGADYIVTGHHADDQVETIIMRLMRGHPHHNLKMLEINGDCFKPFLDVSKEEITRCVKSRNLSWVEDETNLESEYERNWMRNEVIPLLSKRRNIVKAIIDGSKK